MKSAPLSLDVPYHTPISGRDGWVDRAWTFFFRSIQSALNPLGVEQSFQLENNQATPALIDGMTFDKAKVGMVAVDYFIQRSTTGVGAQWYIEAGTFFAAYAWTPNGWYLFNTPTTSGITLSLIDVSKGTIGYTSTNMTGTGEISKITWRARTLAAKNSLYSIAGST